MEVCLCIYKVKQVQEAAVLFITIPCWSKAKQLGMISEIKLLLEAKSYSLCVFSSLCLDEGGTSYCT